MRELLNTLKFIPQAVSESPLQLSFWGNLFSGFIAGAIVSILIPRILDRRKRPRVRFTFANSDQQTTRLKVGEEAVLKLAVTNDNPSTTLNLYYWHLFFPNNLETKLHPSQRTASKEEDGKWIHYKSGVTDPLFPSRAYDFPYKVSVKCPDKGTYYIYYFFSTEYGLSPRSARVAEMDLERAINERKLGFLTLIAE